jgi:hypothetical protein
MNVTYLKLKSINDIKRREFSSKDHHLLSVFNEFDRVFNELNDIMCQRKPLLNENGEHLTLIEIEDLINGYKIKLDKLRLIIEHKIYSTTNINVQTKIKYIVCRSFWVDDNGQRVRMFSKNIGPESKVTIDDVVSDRLFNNTKNILLGMMKKQYEKEYGMKL